VPEDVEREHIKRATEILTNLTGLRPVGWMTGRPGPNTRRLLVETDGFLYDRDSLADELPYWLVVNGRSHLVIPYSYETNDNRFNENSGFSTGEQFFTYMRDAFELLRREGVNGSPKLLSIGLHDRLIGRPGRCTGLVKLLEYMRSFDDVWFCTGAEIAHHWHSKFPP
jgi:peptidoglycan/xylan/chitin deacetylase (PgdA/CDA1 family)